MRIDLKNNKFLTFNHGKFDEWCVYEIDENEIKKAPLDIEYFTELKNFSDIFNPDMLYNDFITLYNETTSEFDKSEIVNIENLVAHYDEYANEIFRIFCILYMGMIAEENKRNTRLGKRIKRLGVYNLLIKKFSPEYCANFMKGMNWKEIDEICKEGGF